MRCITTHPPTPTLLYTAQRRETIHYLLPTTQLYIILLPLVALNPRMLLYNTFSSSYIRTFHYILMRPRLALVLFLFIFTFFTEVL